jgi:hypothetical protein
MWQGNSDLISFMTLFTFYIFIQSLINKFLSQIMKFICKDHDVLFWYIYFYGSVI